MTRPVRFRRQARIEFDEAADWYESRRIGLGPKFTAAVRSVIETATTTPSLHPRVFEDVREGLVHGFPYCVYYRDTKQQILVIAIFHTSRDPSNWQSRA